MQPRSGRLLRPGTLPRPPEQYDVRQVGDEWRVTIGGIEEPIYSGAGPVEVIRSNSPF